MARDPKHTFITVSVNAEQADHIERLFGPLFTLGMYPPDLQPSDPEAEPAYFLMLTEAGRAMLSST